MKLSAQIKFLLLNSVHCDFITSDDIASLDDAVEEFRSDNLRPLKELRSNYQVRAKINQNNGNPTIGFDELLHQLNTMDDEPVSISVFLAPAGRFIVLTDAGRERLFGALFTRCKPHD